MLKNNARAVAALLSMSFLAACPQQTAVWIAAGSTAEQLTFVLGSERGDEEPLQTPLRVDACGAAAGSYNDPLWFADVDASRVAYGRSGPGVESGMDAGPLPPGCYQVDITGTGGVRFMVGEDGSVRELASSSKEP